MAKRGHSEITHVENFAMALPLFLQHCNENGALIIYCFESVATVISRGGHFIDWSCT